MRRRLTGQSGMTIIEILVALVIFMAGFSILIALMNSTLLKFSTKELLVADNLASEWTALAVADQDTTKIDTVVVRSGMQFRVVKNVELTDRIAAVTITVSRAKQTRQLVELCDAFVVPRQ